MKLSVAICTWNRAAMLRETLRSLSAARPPDEPWEVVVVDNNSTDATPAVVAEFEDCLPLRRVSETRQGHSHSRNRAVAEATGRFLVWTDDDVQVDSRWLVAYAEALDRHPGAGFLGGPIEPDYLARRPRWLQENAETCDGVYARRQLGDRPIRLDAERLPFGANFATRRELHEVYSFRGKFGRVGDEVRGYDEIDVLSRMAGDGHEGYWVPGAAVRHRIPASRMTLQYVYDYFHGQGQTWIARRRVEPDVAALRQQIRYHRRRYRIGRICLSSGNWFGHWVQWANLSGQLDQLERETGPGPPGRTLSGDDPDTPGL